MLRSSLGFHTMTLFLKLSLNRADLLITDFDTYRKNTGLIEIYKKNERGEPIIYYHRSPFMPLELNIYFKGRYRGIKWYIRASKASSSSSDYVVEATINPKILAGIIDYLTAATYSDINYATANFNSISHEISPLLQSFYDYKISRVDYCVNISLDEIIPGYNSEQIMNLIKRSDIPPHYEEWMIYDKKAHRMKSKPESFYLISKSVNINYYSKYLQLQNVSQEKIDKGFEPIDPEVIAASRNIYRFEVQCKYYKTYSLSQKAAKVEDFSCNKYKSLLTPVKCIEIISNYYKKTIGEGDWYTLSEAIKIIKSKNYNCQREKKLINTLKYVNQYRSLYKAKKTIPEDQLRSFNEALNDLSNLNINPVAIPREWNIKHIPNLLRTYFNKLLLASCDYSMENIEMDSTIYGYMTYKEKFGHPPI